MNLMKSVVRLQRKSQMSDNLLFYDIGLSIDAKTKNNNSNKRAVGSTKNS